MITAKEAQTLTDRLLPIKLVESLIEEAAIAGKYELSLVDNESITVKEQLLLKRILESLGYWIIVEQLGMIECYGIIIDWSL